tara:strand:+ start:2301 stop:5261 length:2961 start_codon:yes stop_codon:yes gene_type:complete
MRRILSLIDKSNFFYFFIFILIVYAFDTSPLIYTFSQSTAFSGVISQSLLNFKLVFAYLIFKISILLFTLALFWTITSNLFGITNPLVTAPLIILYIYIYNLIEQPAIFDDILGSNYLIQRLNILLPSQSPQLVLIAGLVFLNYFSYKQNFKIKSSTVVGNLILILFMYFQLPYSINHTEELRLPKVNETPNKPNVVILGIDSLASSEKLNLKKGPLRNFINHSSTYKLTITPIANTRPAYNSIIAGKLPPAIRQRFPLEIETSSEDSTFSTSPIKIFKKNGYTTHFMLDDASYNRPKEGEIFDEVNAPENTDDFRKYVFPILLRSRVIFTFFNNALGNTLFPGIYGNFAFNYAYKLPGFTEKIVKKIGDLKKEQNPFLLMAHTSALHFPGNLRFPYYVRGGPQDPDMLGFGSRAPYLNAVSEYLPEPGVNTANYYPKIYASGVQMIQDQFLVPILHELSENNLLENTIVVIFSDHGESFWNNYELPRLKLPNHGIFLLGDDKSHESFLEIYIPGEDSSNSRNTFSLDKMLHHLCALSKLECVDEGKDNNHVYTETGMFPLKVFQDQFFFKTFKFSELFKINSRGKIYLADDVETPAIIQKFRGVYDDPYRLTLYLANDGYRIFLCNIEKDPKCSKNLANEKTKKAKGLLAKILDFASDDIRRNLLPVLQVNQKQPDYADFSIDENHLSNYSQRHLSLIYAISQIERNLNLRIPVKILIETIKDPRFESYLKERATDEITNLCENGILDSHFWARYSKDELMRYFSENEQSVLLTHGCKGKEEFSIFSQKWRSTQQKFTRSELDNKILQLRQEASQTEINHYLHRHIGSYRRKKISAIKFFNTLKNNESGMSEDYEKTKRFLNANYPLSLSLNLREEFDEFWYEAFNYFEEKFGLEGSYFLIAQIGLNFRISNKIFFNKIFPILKKDKNSSLTKCINKMQISQSIHELKSAILLKFSSKVFCKESNHLCDLIKTKLSLEYPKNLCY